jgi:hypothetical protein
MVLLRGNIPHFVAHVLAMVVSTLHTPAPSISTARLG